MTTFVDTSALFALLDENDANHVAAATWMRGPGADPADVLMTHDYVAVETIALVRSRLGALASMALIDAWLPALSILFVDPSLHNAAVSAYRSALRAKPSFVDHVSFQVMRERGVARAFAFDRDFARQGLTTVPR
jgi:predicted nucleic acid-binding protein